jgi:tetratricopeptide (TPR) repeat protein
LFREALDGYLRLLGIDHPDKIVSNHLAGLLCAPINREALEERRQLFGDDRPHHNDDVKYDGGEQTPFQHWLQRHYQQEPTLLARITYAQELCLQAYNDVSHYYSRDDPEDILLTLQETPLRDGQQLASEKGISVDWFLDVFCQTPFIQTMIINGCELWFLRNVGVNEMLRRLGIKSGPFADHVHTFTAAHGLGDVYTKQAMTKLQATVFVSYTGRYLLRNFVEVLDELRGEYIWIDVFCVDQFAWTGHKGSSQVKAFKDALVRTLPQQITQIGRVALLLERWDEVPRTLHQIWVLWEIFNAIQVGADLTILLSNEELAKYIACIQFRSDGAEQAQKALADIRCQDATSEDEYVRQTILEKMQDQHNKVNTKVIEQVREWYHQKGMSHLKGLSFDDGPDRLRYLNRFAELLRRHGKLTEAEPLYWQALEGRRRLLGNDHPDTLHSLDNFAGLLHAQGKLIEAEPLFRESLALRRLLLGSNHPDTLTSINNLAELWRCQGKLIEAEPLYWQALEGRRRLLGNDHPDTLTSINNLAELLRCQGKQIEAEPLFRESLAARRRLLGNDHPDTLTSINNFAGWLHAQGKLTEAEPLFRGTLAARRWLLGNDHPDTLTSMNNLAELLRCKGKLTEAEPLYRQALEERRRMLGDNHPDTLHSLNNFARWLHAKGKPIEAEPLFRETLAEWRRLLGNDHPDTLTSINNLAELLRCQGKLTEAEPLYWQSLEGRRRLLGDDHPDTLHSLNSFAGLLHAQGQLTEAEPLFRETLAARRRVLGNDHPDTLTSIINLASLLHTQGMLTESALLFRHALEARRRVLDNDHTDTLETIIDFTIVLRDQGKLTKADIIRQVREVLESGVGQ